MIISKYAVKLIRLETEHLELLRYWRNNAHISRFMEYREEITSEMQKEWFLKINNTNNFFFIIAYKHTTLGMINTSKIDYDKGVADTGLFVWDEDYINSPVPVLASLSMLDVFFTVFDLKKMTAKVKNDNIKAIAYNKALGYQYEQAVADGSFSLYALSKEDYYRQASRLRQAALRMYGSTASITFAEQNNMDKDIYKMLQKKQAEESLFPLPDIRLV